jgi:hypothetical protein
MNVAGGGLAQFQGNLINQSTNATLWDTLNTTAGTLTVGTGAKFLFSGSSVSATQLFTDPGLLLTGGFDGSSSTATGIQVVSTTAATTGFDDNYAIGQLWLTNTTLELAQAVPDGLLTNALFVNDLYLFGGSHLVISNNMDVYFVNSNNWNLASVTLLGDAQLHQLVPLSALAVVPEPNVLVMWLFGVATLWAARRRRRR